jgi:hypothetical protein
MTIASRYTELSADRQPYLDEGRRMAELTIPTLLPPQGHNNTTKYKTPYQSLGSRGVNNLASKLLMALLPTNTSFARLSVSDDQLEKLGAKARGEVEVGLSKIEKQVMTQIETRAIRVSGFEALKQLIVAGNALTFIAPDGGMKVYRVDRYVVSRDTMGSLMEIILLEQVNKNMLPKNVHEQLPPDINEEQAKSLDIYTHCTRKDNKWAVIQECMGVRMEDTAGVYSEQEFPYQALRFVRIDGENYGRGYVEEYKGDLYSLESLSKSIIDASAAMAKLLFLVKPGVTKATTLSKAKNGSFVAGDANDVTALQINKSVDLQVTKGTIEMLNSRLSSAFLLNSAVQRNAERVSAEEIRYVAQELETALGGVYSILSQDWQLPLVGILLAGLTKAKKIPKIPKGIEPMITSGLEQLGRQQDIEKLGGFIQFCNALGPEVLGQECNKPELVKRFAAAMGIDPLGLLKTPEEKQVATDEQTNQMQQQMMAQGMVKAAPQLAQQMGQPQPQEQQ